MLVRTLVGAAAGTRVIVPGGTGASAAATAGGRGAAEARRGVRVELGGGYGTVRVTGADSGPRPAEFQELTVTV